jgi:Zn-dependent M16 (insulinase) family peptidase
MNSVFNPQNPDIVPGDRIAGYHVDTIVALEEIKAVLYRLTHLATGARHVHIATSDLENTFSVALKTVPSDATGVAHILEHTVLCGSAKFPVRDPFFSMLKRSLSTFMNAFTASDWTMYPFSTQNRKDFYNLMDVYLDAVFYPRLDELSFKQEGHRLEVAEDGDDPLHLVYKGVVYNEMKGAMSSPDQVLGRSLLNALYPETTYRFNSGGDPKEIPRLTHQELKAFHQRHYHPSNAFFYTYGNLPLKDHLAFIEAKILRHFHRIDPQTTVVNQPHWQQPKTLTYSYPLAKRENPDNKYQTCVAWLTADIQDAFEVLVLTILEQILMGNSASPLRKALMDSGLGSALSDASGYDSDNRDTFFSCGLKEITKSAAPKIEEIVLATLKHLVDEGIDNELIESAVHQIEFHRKEITNTPYPYGIRLLLTFVGAWLHGAPPERILHFDADLAKLRDALSKGPFLEEKIRHYFLENPHRVLLVLEPDHTLSAAEEERVTAELALQLKRMDSAQVQQIRQDATVLKQRQESREDVTCLPTLQIDDIPPAIRRIQPQRLDHGEATAYYQQDTLDIFYAAGAIGAGSVPERLLPLVPFYCYAFTKSGSALSDYVQMARRIDRYTGGIGLASQARTHMETAGEGLAFLTLSGKCLYRNQEPMFDILAELLLEGGFTDLGRLKQLLLEYRAAMEAMVVHNGHRLAISLASRNFSAANALGEMWGGIQQLQYIKTLSNGLDEVGLEALSTDLKAISEALLRGENMKIAAIGEADALTAAQRRIDTIRKQMRSHAGDGFKVPPLPLAHDLPQEGWSTSTAVSFVAQAFVTVRMTHADAPSLSVLAKMLRSLYLHREIREKGGAYGGFAIYNPEDGLFSLGSYRDPHIAATLKVYDGCSEFFQKRTFSDEDVKEAVLQVCSEIDKPDPPGPAARKAFYRRIIGLSDEARQQYKENLLRLTRQQVIEVAVKYLAPDSDRKAVAVIASEERLQEANTKLSSKPLQLHQI